jgi:DNA-binding NtrC family response regulator
LPIIVSKLKLFCYYFDIDSSTRAQEEAIVDSFTVLFVDDETDFVESLIKRMQRRNIKAYGVHSGEEALDFLACDDISVDVVVLDVRMQGMNGIETLKTLKRRYPLMEVIMLSGHANLAVAKEGMEMGAFDYLMKPVDLDELLYKLQDTFQKKHLTEVKKKKVQDVN